MPRLRIDDREVEVPEGATVLDAARALGLDIPTLCHRDGLPHHTSCMLCVVRDRATGRLLPSCSYPAADRLDLESGGEAVRAARHATLSLLLSEHVGDCEAPCHRVCPARMHIPQMIRQIDGGRLDDAHITAKRDLVLPSVLGRICPRPCEKGCRRALHDEAVSIAALHRHAADIDLAAAAPWQPELPALNGRRVAIVGAGPAGLACAWHLRRMGFACTIFDAAGQAGGALRTDVPEEKLPRAVLDAELRTLSLPGIALHFGIRVDDAAGLLALRDDADAVVLATGKPGQARLEALGVPRGPRGAMADPRVLQTPLGWLFVAGDVVHGAGMAVRSVGDGRVVAESIRQWLAGRPVTGRVRPFNSRIGKLLDGELAGFLAGADARGRIHPAGDGLSPAEAELEAERCLDCDCRKAVTCRLRRFADAYGVDQDELRPEIRGAVEVQRAHARVVFEGGKCIKCGICVRLTAQRGVPGMTFAGRGYDAIVAPPFGTDLAAAFGEAALDCAEACPTAAIAVEWEET